MEDFWEYDPSTDSWTKKADFPGGGWNYATGFSIKGKGYLGTGQDRITADFKKDIWEYDLLNNTWIRKADFPGTPRFNATGFSIKEKGYLGFGWDGM